MPLSKKSEILAKNSPFTENQFGNYEASINLTTGIFTVNAVLLEDYHCESDFAWYPFDTVKCRMHMVSDRPINEMIFELINMVPQSHKEVRSYKPLHTAGWTVTEQPQRLLMEGKSKN